MNKFFKSKSKKEFKFVSKEVNKSQRETTEVMGAVIGTLPFRSRGVSNDDNCSNNATDGNGKIQALKPSTIGIMEGHKRIRMNKNAIQPSDKMTQSPMEKSIVNPSFKTTINNGEESFKKAEVEETFINRQSRILIAKGPGDKIIVARKTHTAERSIRFTKNYFNNVIVDEDTPGNVQVSSTTENGNDCNELSIHSNENLNSTNKLKTYKNSQKVIGLADSSESDSTIVLPLRNFKKNKKIKNNTNYLSTNKKSMIIAKQNFSVSENSKKLKTIENRNPLSHKKNNNIQDIPISDFDSTVILTPTEYKDHQKIMSNNSNDLSVCDSDSTVLLTPVEQDKSQIISQDEVSDIFEDDSDSTLFLTPIEELENRKTKMNNTSDKAIEPPEKKSRNSKICGNALSQLNNEDTLKLSAQEWKEKLFKIFEDERLCSLGLSFPEFKEKIAAIFRFEESNTSLTFSSQELKEKLDKIIEDEESVNHNKSPEIDELKRKLAEIFEDEVSCSQIESPPPLLTQELFNILEPSQNDNAAIDESETNQSKCPDNSVERVSSLNSSELAQAITSQKKTSRSQSGAQKFEDRKIGLETSSVVNGELEDTLTMDQSNNGQILDDTLKLPETNESTGYELLDSSYQNYNEDSEDLTDSSIEKLVIDESTDEITEFMDTSNINEITEYPDNSEENPLNICVLECETQPDEQEHIKSLRDNKIPDSSVSSKKTKVDDSDINLEKLDKKRELLILVERVDVNKFKQKNFKKVSNSSKARSSLKKKISLSTSHESSDLCLKKELRVRLERMPLKMNPNNLKVDNKVNRIKSQDKSILKLNSSLKKSTKIIKNNTIETVSKIQMPLKEVRIILTPIQWKDHQNLKTKQINNLGFNATLTSSTGNRRLTRSSSVNAKDSKNNTVSSSISKSTRKRLDYTDSVEKTNLNNKKRSRAKSNLKAVKNTPNTSNLVKKRKIKTNLNAFKNKVNSINKNQHKNLKNELRVTLERLSSSDLVMWQRNH